MKIDWLLIITYGILFAFMITVVWLVTSNIEEMTTHPFLYGAKRMGGVDCRCMQYNDDGSIRSQFAFNSTSLWDLNQETSVTNQQIQYNGLK